MADRVFFRQVGVEGRLADVHEHIRYKRDVTTEFIRYDPDGFACWAKTVDKPSLLIEFKTATTGFKYDNASPLKTMRQTVADLKKEEIANIELGSFENMIRLRSVGVDVIVWMFVSYHLTNKFLVIVPDERLNLLKYGRDQMQQTAGSGTPIANVFTRVDRQNVFALPEWVASYYELDLATVEAFFREKETAFPA